ncbi:MAG TPA: hypothetical protein VGH19_21440 [Verrucomicrobiae bacterium]
MASLALPRWQNASAVLSDGRVIIIGGRTNSPVDSVASLSEVYDPISNIVSPAAHLQIPRGLAKATTLLDGRVLVSGGTTVSNLSVLRTEIYDPVSNSFALGGNLTYPRVSTSTATLLADGRVLLVGGSGLAGSVVEIFNPASNTVSTAGTLIDARSGAHTVTLLQNGKVLIVGGGITVPTITGKAEVYDPATMTSTAVGSLALARRGHTASLLPDGRVLIAGGAYDAGDGGFFVTASTEIFDPVTQTFSAGPAMLTVRENARAVTLLTGQVLITGGRTPGLITTAELFDTEVVVRSADWYALLDTIENLTATLTGVQLQLTNALNQISGLTITNNNLQAELNYAHDTIDGLTTTNAQLQAQINVLQPNPFRMLPQDLPPRPRIHTFTTSDGRVLMLSGITTDVAATKSVSVFDPMTETMTTAGGINSIRAGHTANLLAGDQILVAGGSVRTTPFSPVIVTNTTEIYTLSTTNSVAGPSMANARISAGSVNLADGRVLVFAGRNDTTAFVAQSEIYEPSSNSFRLSGVMPALVNLPTVTLLQDGRVLIYGSSTNDVPAIQVFDPATETFTSVSGLATGRIGHQASLLADGRVLISGGRTVVAGLILKTTEIFNPSTGTFSAGPDMLTARQSFSSTALLDGTVLIAGGQTNTAPNLLASAKAEIFNPVTGTFTAAGVMATNQYFHNGVLLRNGAVLLTGGMPGTTTSLLFKAQLYDPTTHVLTSQYGNLNLLIDDLEAENDDLVTQLASVQLQLNIATNTITGLTITNASLQAALANANTTIAGLVVTNAQLQADLEACQAEKAALLTQINTLTNQIAQLQNTITTLTAQNNALTNQVAQQQATINSLVGQVNSLTNQVAQQQSTINTLTAQNSALTNQVAQLQTTIGSLQTQNNALTNQVATLTQQNTQLQTALTAEQAQNATLTAQVAQQAALIVSLQAQNTQLQAELTGTQNQVNSLMAAFQNEFNDPTFVIPGATLQQQVQNLITAILELNHGQRSALYDKLD